MVILHKCNVKGHNYSRAHLIRTMSFDFPGVGSKWTNLDAWWCNIWFMTATTMTKLKHKIFKWHICISSFLRHICFQSGVYKKMNAIRDLQEILGPNFSWQYLAWPSFTNTILWQIPLNMIKWGSFYLFWTCTQTWLFGMSWMVKFD